MGYVSLHAHFFFHVKKSILTQSSMSDVKQPIDIFICHDVQSMNSVLIKKIK